jgi:hypothetical protein
MSELPEVDQERTAVPSFLRQVARRHPASANEEHCELCSANLGPVHLHLLDPRQRQIICSCDACAMLFSGQENARYLRVPRRIRRFTHFRMAGLEWESLMIPINLAFFYYDSGAHKTMAMYPSPAGAIESLLSLESWTQIAAGHPALATMQPDVETFLVNRITAEHEYYIVPIDECFRLVGIIRLHWRGLSGGAEVWKEIARFFIDLKARATEVTEPESTHA